MSFDGSAFPGGMRGARERLLWSEILAAAQNLLESGSAESVMLRSIAREAGITAPAVYSHFRNREEIMLAIVEEAFEELEDALRGGDHLEPVAQLRAVYEAYLQFARECPQRYRLMFGGVWNAADALADAADPPDLSMLGMGPMQVLVEAIERGAKAGELDSAAPFDDAAAQWGGAARVGRTAPDGSAVPLAANDRGRAHPPRRTTALTSPTGAAARPLTTAAQGAALTPMRRSRSWPRTGRPCAHR